MASDVRLWAILVVCRVVHARATEYCRVAAQVLATNPCLAEGTDYCCDCVCDVCGPLEFCESHTDAGSHCGVCSHEYSGSICQQYHQECPATSVITTTTVADLGLTYCATSPATTVANPCLADTSTYCCDCGCTVCGPYDYCVFHSSFGDHCGVCSPLYSGSICQSFFEQCPPPPTTTGLGPYCHSDDTLRLNPCSPDGTDYCCDCVCSHCGPLDYCLSYSPFADHCGVCSSGFSGGICQTFLFECASGPGEAIATITTRTSDTSRLARVYCEVTSLQSSNPCASGSEYCCDCGCSYCGPLGYCINESPFGNHCGMCSSAYSGVICQNFFVDCTPQTTVAIGSSSLEGYCADDGSLPVGFNPCSAELTDYCCDCACSFCGPLDFCLRSGIGSHCGVCSPAYSGSICPNYFFDCSQPSPSTTSASPASSERSAATSYSTRTTAATATTTTTTATTTASTATTLVATSSMSSVVSPIVVSTPAQAESEDPKTLGTLVVGTTSTSQAYAPTVAPPSLVTGSYALTVLDPAMWVADEGGHFANSIAQGICAAAALRDCSAVAVALHALRRLSAESRRLQGEVEARYVILAADEREAMSLQSTLASPDLVADLMAEVNEHLASAGVSGQDVAEVTPLSSPHSLLHVPGVAGWPTMTAHGRPPKNGELAMSADVLEARASFDRQADQDDQWHQQGSGWASHGGTYSSSMSLRAVAGVLDLLFAASLL